MTEAVDILLLSTYDTDGAGKFTHQLADSLRSLGYSTRVVSVRNRSDDDSTVGIIDNSPLQKIIYRFAEEFDRRIIRPRPKYTFIHLRSLADKTVLASNVWPTRCRIIICTFLAGMMSPTALLSLRSRYGFPPVVFYGVDMNFYTAGCHYARECTGYLRQCSACPAVPWFAKRKVMRDFQQKLVCYKKLNPLVAVASSHEHYEQMTQASLLKNVEIKKILMAVDDCIYGRHEPVRRELKEKYHFKKRVMLIRSSSEPRKGCDLFVEAIKDIGSELPELLKNTTIVAVGDQFIAEQLSENCVNIFSPGYVSGEDELSMLYAMADVFLMTSRADSGPVMLAQALMSGTPVISTDVGLARDLVFPEQNGEILTSLSAKELKKCIVSFLVKTDAEIDSMRRKTRELAQSRLNKSIYIDNLESLISGVLLGRENQVG